MPVKNPYLLGNDKKKFGAFLFIEKCSPGKKKSHKSLLTNK